MSASGYKRWLHIRAAELGLVQTEKPAVTENVTENRLDKLLSLIVINPSVSTGELSSILHVTRRTIARDIATLKAAGRLRRVGPDKGGHWEVCG